MPAQWNALRQMLVGFQALDVDIDITQDEVFSQFIKDFRSQTLLEDFITASTLMKAPLTGSESDPQRRARRHSRL